MEVSRWSSICMHGSMGRCACRGAKEVTTLRAFPFRAAGGWLVCAVGEVSSGLLHAEAARSSCMRIWISC